MTLQRIFVSVVLGWVPLAGASELRWEKFEGCRVVESPHNDGDSVEIECNGQRKVIRFFRNDFPKVWRLPWPGSKSRSKGSSPSIGIFHKLNSSDPTRFQ